MISAPAWVFSGATLASSSSELDSISRSSCKATSTTDLPATLCSTLALPCNSSVHSRDYTYLRLANWDLPTCSRGVSNPPHVREAHLARSMSWVTRWRWFSAGAVETEVMGEPCLESSAKTLHHCTGQVSSRDHDWSATQSPGATRSCLSQFDGRLRRPWLKLSGPQPWKLGQLRA